MAINWTSYRAGLRAVINQVWPEVDRDAGGGGIWTVPRIEQVALEDLRSDEAITTAAVIQESPPVVTDERVGIANQAYSVETRIHYVRRRDMVTDMEEFILARLVDMEQYLLHNALPLGQVIDVTGLDASEGNVINAILLEKNKSYFGGTLTAMIEIGESPA